MDSKRENLETVSPKNNHSNKQGREATWKKHCGERGEEDLHGNDRTNKGFRRS